MLPEDLEVRAAFRSSDKNVFVRMLKDSAYVSLSDLASCCDKRALDIIKSNSSEELLTEFKNERDYENVAPYYIRAKKGNGDQTPLSRLYIHPDIAVQFAQLCSPRVALWISRQIREVLSQTASCGGQTEGKNNDVLIHTN